MLKFENTAENGDLIRAYDFEPMTDRPDTYVTGWVEAKGPIFVEIEEGRKAYICDGYTIHCQYDTEGRRTGETVYVPFEMGFTDFDARIKNLTVKLLEEAA